MIWRAALLALALAGPAVAEITFSGRADIRATRLSSTELQMETRLTNAQPYAICLREVSSDAYFSNGSSADLAFDGLEDLTGEGGVFRVDPGQSFGARFNARLLTLETIRARIIAESGPDRADRIITRIRRYVQNGQYYFELSYTFRRCGQINGPNPWVTITLGRSEIVRLR